MQCKNTVKKQYIFFAIMLLDICLTCYFLYYFSDVNVEYYFRVSSQPLKKSTPIKRQRGMNISKKSHLKAFKNK